MRRYLIIAPQYYPRVGGYANAVGNLVRALSESGDVAVTLITPEPLADAPEQLLANVEVIRLARYQGRIRYAALIEQIQWVGQLLAHIRGQSWDLVLFESLENPITTFAVLLRLGRKRSGKVAVRIHGTNAMEGFRNSTRTIDRLYWWFVRRVLLRVRNITTTTSQYFRFLEETVFFSRIPAAKHLGVVSNIVWPPAPVSDDEGDTEQIVMLSLGRMNQSGYVQKNFELIPRAVHLLRARRKDIAQNMQIKIVGDGEMLPKFRKVIEDLKVTEHFELIARLPNEEIRALQQQVAAVLLVSRYEGQSMFALEALAAGAPLILSRDTGVSDLVAADISNGALVDPLDALDLADAMIRLCDADLSELRRASVAHYTAYYRPQKVLRELFDFSDGL